MGSLIRYARLMVVLQKIMTKRNEREPVLPAQLELHPGSFDFHVGLTHAPGVVGGFQMWSATSLEFRSVLLHPAVDRGVINCQPGNDAT